MASVSTARNCCAISHPISPRLSRRMDFGGLRKDMPVSAARAGTGLVVDTSCESSLVIEFLTSSLAAALPQAVR